MKVMKMTDVLSKRIILFFMIVMMAFVTPSVVMINAATIEAQAAAKPALSKTKATIYVGNTCKIQLKNVKSGVKWTTSKKSVATVKASGTSVTITGKKTGTATITATYKKKKYKCTVTVKKKAVSLSATTKSVKIGDTFNLSLKNGGSGAKWSVSNSCATIKKVNNTKYTVTAKKKGVVSVKVKYSGKTYTCKITITDPNYYRILVDSDYVGAKSSIPINGSEHLQLANILSNKGNPTWSVSDSSILELQNEDSGNCRVYGLKPGTATVTLSWNGNKYTHTVTVTNKVVTKVYLSSSVIKLKEGEIGSVTLIGASGILRWGLYSGQSSFNTENLNGVFPNGTETTNNTYQFKVSGKTDDDCFISVRTSDDIRYVCKVIVE